MGPVSRQRSAGPTQRAAARTVVDLSWKGCRRLRRTRVRSHLPLAPQERNGRTVHRRLRTRHARDPAGLRKLRVPAAPMRRWFVAGLCVLARRDHATGLRARGDRGSAPDAAGSRGSRRDGPLRGCHRPAPGAGSALTGHAHSGDRPREGAGPDGRFHASRSSAPTTQSAPGVSRLPAPSCPRRTAARALP
jgi:hypothetical protein